MNPSDKIALIAVTRQGLECARRLRKLLTQHHKDAKTGDRVCVFAPSGQSIDDQLVVQAARLHDSGRRAACTTEQEYEGPLSAHVAGWFGSFDQLVFFLAAGAVVRLIAPCLASKKTDPGVLAIDEAGQFVIPLLSGHVGGANAFARTVAGCLGTVPVITTASDVIGGLSLDSLAKEFDWTAEPDEHLKTAAMRLVQNEPVAIVQELGTKGAWLDERELPANVTFAADVGLLPDRPFAATVWITDRKPQGEVLRTLGATLWMRPRSLVLGVGCERGISLAALEDGLQRFLDESGFALVSVGVLATATVKEDEAGLRELADKHGWRTVFYPAEELAKVANIPNPSAVVEQCVGTPGVAEPAAMLAGMDPRGSEYLTPRRGGMRAELVVEKRIMTSSLAPQRMTFALARMASFQRRMHEKGKVTFIGAGPGDPELLTLKASRVMKRADVVIYAGSLIPERILEHAPRTAVIHNSAHMTLEQVTQVVQSAVSAGRHVVRLQSGDPSIYGAIQEQIAYLERHGIDYDIVPGISSFQAAAAALRSELTIPEVVQTIILTRDEGDTPMPEREALAALAQHQATLCIFLSARLADALQEKLLTAYPPETPAALAYRVSWPEEKIVLTRVDRIAEEIRAQKWTRTVLILVGKAIAARQNRSHLYDPEHGHILRARA